MDNREKMLKELMAADFTVIDLHLYLNTHPTDTRAIMFYNSSVHKANILRANFEKMYGPINSQYSYSKSPWQWIEEPWPWQWQ